MQACDKAKADGIWLRSEDYRQPCPKCSPTRRKKKDPCLHVTWASTEVKVFCHHCGWGVTYHDDDERHTPRTNQRARSGPKPSLRQRSARGW